MQARDKSIESKIQHKANIDLLNNLYLKHITTFAYQNFELRKISRQHPIKRDALSLFSARNQHDLHSGYCFQSAEVLYRQLLEHGFTVTLSIARVLNGLAVNSKELLDLPATHLILIVEIDNKHYLLDPSFTREPVVITEKIDLSITDSYRCYPVDESVYVLEKRNPKSEYVRLIQSNLQKASDQSIEFSMLQLARFPKKLGIRDELTLVDVGTKNGRKLLYLQLPTKAFAESHKEDSRTKKITPQEEKMTKAFNFTVIDGETVKKRFITSLDEVCQILAEEFGITTISPEQLEKYIDNQALPLPMKPWTVDFPLDKRGLEKMAALLTPSSSEKPYKMK